MVFKPGPMELNTKESGKKIRHMEKVNFGMLMEIFLKVIGKMTRQMVMEYIFM